VAAGGGNLSGIGTFNGNGFIQNGGGLRPGSSPGILTWTGNLTVEPGGTLEIEIAGITVGTQHDRVNVSGNFTMNGELNIRLLDGFAPAATDTFDIVTAGAALTGPLVGTRVQVSNAYGSFEVLMVTGNTLRLANYQVEPPTFAQWASQRGLNGLDAAANADPDHNGLPNLLEYATGYGEPGSGCSLSMRDESGERYLSLSYTRPAAPNTPSDILYAPERATTLALLGDWSELNVVPVGTVPGPGSLETVTVRSLFPVSGQTREFMRLGVHFEAGESPP
jgi:hypothetical protein